MTTTSGLAILVFVPLLFEAVVAARHGARLRALGAVEPPGDVYPAMQVMYPAAFVAMIAEKWVRGSYADQVFDWGLGLFVAAKLLKYWAIITLGTRWTFRVLVPPGSTPVTAGPYRFLRHPNYVAVIGELAGVALMAHALISGPLATAAFAGLIARRIAIEERALGVRR